MSSDGKPLSGNNSYSVTFPAGQLPPVNGFWSMTLYSEHHFFNPNPLRRFSLGTKNKNLQTNSDGSLTLYAGAKSPGKDKETASAGCWRDWIRERRCSARHPTGAGLVFAAPGPFLQEAAKD